MPFKHQPSDQVVNLESWYLSADYDGVFPIGSRPKKLVISKSEQKHSFILPNHRYLFKESFPRHPDQFWIEIVAYHVGHFIGINVPPTFVAYSHKLETYGALIEWFYGFAGQKRKVYINGGNFMKGLMKDYDYKKGMQHNFKSITIFIKALIKSGYVVEDWISHWAKIFTFDAIIGNTDRHHDNWGLMWHLDRKEVEFSPAFDNGTSLGYEILDSNIPLFSDEKRLMKYINRGTHHMKWNINEERSTHTDLINKFLDSYPISKEIVIRCLDFDIERLKESIMQLIDFQINTPLREVRVNFMLNLIKHRRDNLLKIIN